MNKILAILGALLLLVVAVPSGQGATAISSTTLSASVNKTISWSTTPIAPSITADNTFSADTAVGAVTSNAKWDVTLSSSALTCVNGTGCSTGETIPNTQIFFKYVGPAPAGSNAGTCAVSCSLDASRTLFSAANKGTATSNGTGDYKVDPQVASGGSYTGTLTFTASN